MTLISNLSQSKSADSSLPLKHQIHHWMQGCRASTLQLFAGVDYATFCQQAHPDFSPVGWHLGHIAYTESLWLLEHLAGQPPQFPEYRRLFAADTLPKTDRCSLPSLAEVQQYLATIRSQVFNYLEIAPLEQQERLWRWLLQHESQHCETIAIVLALLRGGGGDRGDGKRYDSLLSLSSSSSLSSLPSSPSPPIPPLLTDMICIPAGKFQQGNEAIEALDNERSRHWLELPTYWIDRYPVTCGQYRQFMQAGGYQDQHWWSSAGWQWLQAQRVSQPLYWSNDPQHDRHPVCGVSWYEAEAYARFVRKRLPTEAEWEKAAGWQPIAEQPMTYPWGDQPPTDQHCNHHHAIGQTTPVDAYPQGKSAYGGYDFLGNVWEWTASWFAGYPNFDPYPYRGYSQAYFDGQHRVLRGGSWATRPWALRSTFRNWYYPHVREVFAGFRCAADREVTMVTPPPP
ncbi:SUMF1/EgtB/PvdO family nonheme iron enzyme [Pantanalinema rosaneae CENA516]|uniref:SUMF1/EgtB/PvdO family nonheme iron enzyme n=1 Tax=Pantanalinema rosaneae TaxID=1620701 RepID=UPI003D6FB03F